MADRLDEFFAVAQDKLQRHRWPRPLHVQIDIEGPEPRSLCFHVSPEGVTHHAGPCVGLDAIAKSHARDWIDLLSGQASADAARADGRLRWSGDLAASRAVHAALFS